MPLPRPDIITQGPTSIQKPKFDYAFRCSVELTTRPDQIADDIAPLDITFFVDWYSPDLYRINYYNFVQMDW